jgi:hypothetical protein
MFFINDVNNRKRQDLKKNILTVIGILLITAFWTGGAQAFAATCQ